MVGSPPANAGDTGLSPGPGGSHVLQSNWAPASQLLSLHAAAAEASAPEAHAPQREGRGISVRVPRTATKTQHSQK